MSKRKLSVAVLTSCASDHVTWANHYPAGETSDGPLRVLRFPTARQRNLAQFRDISRTVFSGRASAAAQEQWFRDNGYDLRRLMSLIAKSNAYQLSSRYSGEWKADTVDTFKAGDPSTRVTGIVTTAMATIPPHFRFWILDFRLSEQEFGSRSKVFSFMCFFSSIQNLKSKIQNVI